MNTVGFITIMIITSKQNTLIKEVRSLLTKKFRDKLNKFVVEGVKMVNEAFATGQKVLTVIATEKCVDRIIAKDIEIQIVTDEVYASISDEKTPQGALAVIEKPPLDFVSPKDSCILLDGLADPGNLGTIIRTMACAGYRHLYLTEDCADAYSPKTVRSSMSGIYHVNVHIADREKLVKQIGLPIVVADMNGVNVFDSQSVNRLIKGEFCLVIGNEAHGVSDLLKGLANATVKIPMQMGMESLNAGVSAGILMYALKNKQ